MRPGDGDRHRPQRQVDRRRERDRAASRRRSRCSRTSSRISDGDQADDDGDEPGDALSRGTRGYSREGRMTAAPTAHAGSRSTTCASCRPTSGTGVVLGRRRARGSPAPSASREPARDLLAAAATPTRSRSAPGDGAVFAARVGRARAIVVVVRPRSRCPRVIRYDLRIALARPGAATRPAGRWMPRRRRRRRGRAGAAAAMARLARREAAREPRVVLARSGRTTARTLDPRTPPPSAPGGRGAPDFGGPAPFRASEPALRKARKLRVLPESALGASGGAVSFASSRSPICGDKEDVMTKSEFVDKVAAESGLSKKDAGAAVDAVSARSRTRSGAGEEVNFTGFGKFHVAERGAREGRNPRTGETMTDRRQQGAALHRRLGPQEGRQVAGAGAPVGRRLTSPAPGTATRRHVRRPARGRRRARESQIVLGIDPDPARLWPAAVERTSEARAALAQRSPRRRGGRRAEPARRPRPPRARGRRRGARPLPRADRRGRPGLRRRQAAARLLRAPRLAGLARARARRARTRARAGLLVLADGKRGDVPVTAAAYAQALVGGTPTPFGAVAGLGADAFTANPLLGRDALEPLIDGARARRRRRVRARAHLQPRRRRPAGPRARDRRAAVGAPGGARRRARASRARRARRRRRRHRRHRARAPRAHARADAAHAVPAARASAPRAATSRRSRPRSRPAAPAAS